ncbi:uncharacterized protein BO96DRAFT_435336 [Aspergillus niger CBS 101883]|uniref:Uncharacterized protein n=1 Tax=Aspergillus niger ATCC 13496 TaxID=1353008 RepID=A0A370BLJ8_ASPNG|nr:uncharacterized protein BO96DRAFT_435336 [Aspergillus niger CBS 101883]PYH55476.1 hypothetical protein BO96DRAFT_435336 [Aspergillus niger CBS 101883]RDH14985.1 hypothetical protein M747DRAFT_326415 [Aspergillus niger ATCC 13496]
MAKSAFSIRMWPPPELMGMECRDSSIGFQPLEFLSRSRTPGQGTCNFGQILAYGGPRLVIFGSICAFVVQIIVILGLSELASAFPSDQVEKVFCIRCRISADRQGPDDRCRSSGIQMVTASVGGIVKFWHTEYMAAQWHIYLIYLAISLLTREDHCPRWQLGVANPLVIPIFLAPSKVNWTAQTALFLSLTGMALIIIITLGMCQEKQPASFLLQPGYGRSGWNEGTAWMLGVMNTMYSMTGIDAAIHISEELPQPEKRVPQAMTMSVILSLATCLPLSVALVFCMSDMEAVVNSELPSLELIYQATKSKGVTTFLSVWLLIVYAARYFAKVDDKLKFPVRTTVASFGFVAIYSLLYLVSSGAFNIITNSAILFLHITYVVPQGIVLISGRVRTLPRRYLNLGCLGYLCNAFVILWIVILGVFVCLPLGLPVEAESMNYTSPVLIGLFGLVIMLWYGLGRIAFQGPQIDRGIMQEVDSGLNQQVIFDTLYREREQTVWILLRGLYDSDKRDSPIDKVCPEYRPRHSETLNGCNVTRAFTSERWHKCCLRQSGINRPFATKITPVPSPFPSYLFLVRFHFIHHLRPSLFPLQDITTSLESLLRLAACSINKQAAYSRQRSNPTVDSHLSSQESLPAMDAHLDLTLPSTCPELHQGSNANWDDASFALYSMVGLSSEDLDKLTTALNREWKQEMTDEAMPLVRTPTVYDFKGESLRDVVRAHVELDKEFTPRDDGGAEGDIHWYPTAFVVVTTREWEEQGLLLVYAGVEEKECPMDKFFFHIDVANVMLSNFEFRRRRALIMQVQLGIRAWNDSWHKMIA